MKLEPRCPDLKYSDLKLKMYCCELTRAIDCEMSQEHNVHIWYFTAISERSLMVNPGMFGYLNLQERQEVIFLLIRRIKSK